MIVISIAVHAAFLRLPQVAKPVSIWLIQILAAWCDAHGITSESASGD
jgi:hypothetical protein